MSPDERFVGEILARAARRQRMLLSITGGAAVAIIGAAATALLTAFAFGIAARVAVVLVSGLAAAMAWSIQRTRMTHVDVTGALERAHVSSRNVIVSADEIARGTLAAVPAVRARVFADAAAALREIELTRVFPLRAAVRIAVVAALAWLVVLTASVWRVPLSRAVPALAPLLNSGAPLDPLRVSVTIQPPAYTGEPSKTIDNPGEIAAIQGSIVSLSVQSSGSRVTVDHDGAVRTLTRGADGRFTDRLELSKNGYVLIAADRGAQRLMPVDVSPDVLPAVRLSVPGRDLVFAGGNRQITFDASATDDFGLRSLSLRFTKVSGSGEQFDFEEGEIPLTVTRANVREWRGGAARTLADLQLQEGDVLVYRAEAADARPGAGVASSDAFFIEISKLGAAAGDAFTLPDEESRYALSEQMLIIKTERLHQRRGSMAAADVAEESLNLAVEQRMIRAEFVFMLGGEVEDEEVEAEQATELLEGRLQNRGQRDLRTATIAMSQAEKLLTGVDTAGALVAERAAVAALQRAFTRSRYILRALATRSQLDMQRRLAGNLSQAADWRRTPAAAAENRRAALLQDLLAGIGELRLRVSEGQVRAVELARLALRIDVDSTALRRAAADLQRIADTWTASTEPSRMTALDTVAAAIAAEARGALSAPSAATPAGDASLAGAFRDVVNGARGAGVNGARGFSRADRSR